METFLKFFEGLPVWVTVLTSVFIALNGVTALTPSSADNRFVNAVLKVLNFLSGNVLLNKNADDK